MKKKHCKVPCGECPFRKNSLPGYLGGFSTTETFQAVTSEDDFDCHLTRDENDEGEEVERMSCAGRMLFASNLAKQFRRKDLEAVRLELKNNTPEHIKENILSYQEFKKHHNKL